MKKEFIVTIDGLGTIKVEACSDVSREYGLSSVFDSKNKVITEDIKLCQVEKLYNAINNGEAHEIINGSYTLQSKMNDSL